jgi:hypothetical protein
MKRSRVSRLSIQLSRPLIKIKDSSIPGAGLGAFVTRDVESGTHLGDYKGEKCKEEDDGDYVLYVSGYTLKGKEVEMCLDAQDPEKSNWTRYINSIKAGDGRVKNAKFFIRSTSRDVAIGVKTIRMISKGDEILVDYGAEYW